MDTKFLQSNRFQAAVVAVVVAILQSYALIPSEVADPIIALCLAHITIRTVDRAFEKIAKIK